MDDKLLHSLASELTSLREKSLEMLEQHERYKTSTVNNLYSSCKSDLIFILNQLLPISANLRKSVLRLPEKVGNYDKEESGMLAGYVQSAQTIVSKLIDKKISFGETPFKPNKFSNKVFIVHGHSTAMLQDVSSFLRKCKLNPIILHEQPNKGRTIIEKFVDYSDVGFAIVLLSPDDKAIHNQKEFFRARQNVIFELGYFIGKLGRERVAALYMTSVEIPSDYSGVLYLEYNNSPSWKLQLCKELKAVGFNIDLNVTFQ